MRHKGATVHTCKLRLHELSGGGFFWFLSTFKPIVDMEAKNAPSRTAITITRIRNGSNSMQPNCEKRIEKRDELFVNGFGSCNRHSGGRTLLIRLTFSPLPSFPSRDFRGDRSFILTTQVMTFAEFTTLNHAESPSMLSHTHTHS